MPRQRPTEEQIILALKQVELGAAVDEVCRNLGVTERTFLRWRKLYGHLGVSELEELRQLREENTRLKNLLADASVDERLLQDVLAKKG